VDSPGFLKWLLFQGKYCLGRNLLESQLCREYLSWAVGLVGLIVLYFVLKRIMKAVRAWLWVRSQGKVARKKTMDSVRWTGEYPRD
jgi:uncharacterized membrane protein